MRIAPENRKKPELIRRLTATGTRLSSVYRWEYTAVSADSVCEDEVRMSLERDNLNHFIATDCFLPIMNNLLQESKSLTLYHVVLRFSRKIAFLVTNTSWHPSQQSIMNPDGSIHLEFQLDTLDEIKWWILDYGDKVEVLTPQELKLEIEQLILHSTRADQ